jgi:hypothetical protein
MNWDSEAQRNEHKTFRHCERVECDPIFFFGKCEREQNAVLEWARATERQDKRGEVRCLAGKTVYDSNEYVSCTAAYK